MYKWIKPDKVLKRGLGDPPSGDLFLIDEKGCMTIKDGILYIDGIKAKPGKINAELRDFNINFVIGAGGEIISHAKQGKGAI